MRIKDYDNMYKIEIFDHLTKFKDMTNTTIKNAEQQFVGYFNNIRELLDDLLCYYDDNHNEDSFLYKEVMELKEETLLHIVNNILQKIKKYNNDSYGHILTESNGSYAIFYVPIQILNENTI
ncbi:MAG: hypothetical protein LBM96_05980 [Methanobrevibacter sp.]|jgi:hemerythrin superfamily protein|nr:hypothetical protein [Candidatus Methanoflexus mossambicus]